MSVGMNYEIYISIEAQERGNENEIILCIYSMGLTNFSFSLVYRYSDDFNLNLEESKRQVLTGCCPNDQFSAGTRTQSLILKPKEKNKAVVSYFFMPRSSAAKSFTFFFKLS